MKSHCCSALILSTKETRVCSNCLRTCCVNGSFEAEMRNNASKKFDKPVGWWKNINKYLKLCQKQIDIDKN